jgi:hypothetical protein
MFIGYKNGGTLKGRKTSVKKGNLKRKKLQSKKASLRD